MNINVVVSTRSTRSHKKLFVRLSSKSTASAHTRKCISACITDYWIFQRALQMIELHTTRDCTAAGVNAAHLCICILWLCCVVVFVFFVCVYICICIYICICKSALHSSAGVDAALLMFAAPWLVSRKLPSSASSARARSSNFLFDLSSFDLPFFLFLFFSTGTDYIYR